MCKIIRGQSCGLSVKRKNVVAPHFRQFSGENILDKGRGTHLAEKSVQQYLKGSLRHSKESCNFPFFGVKQDYQCSILYGTRLARLLKCSNMTTWKVHRLILFFCILIWSDLKISSVFSSDCSAKMFKWVKILNFTHFGFYNNLQFGTSDVSAIVCHLLQKWAI